MGNVTGVSLTVSGNISSLSLNSGDSVLGNVSAASLSVSGNVSGLSLTTSVLYANASKFGLFDKASSLNASTQSANIPALNVSAGLTGEDCGTKINAILTLLQNYGLML
jgi:hypothetical protein